MVIQGYLISENTDLLEIESQIQKVQKKILNIRQKEYQHLLGKEIAFCCDCIALNILQRPTQGSMKDEQKTYILHGHAEKVIHGKNGYCGIYVPIKRYQNGSFQTVWYLASFFNSNISVVKGDTVFLRGYRISDKSYNGFDYLDLTCSDIIGIHNL